jgi:hypothetical protein
MKDYWKQAVFFTITVYLVTISILLIFVYENRSKNETEVIETKTNLKDSLEIEYYKLQLKTYNEKDTIFN